MTRTIFGRRQAVLRQRARQEAWRLALRDELETHTLANARPEPESVEATDVVAITSGRVFRPRDPRD